MRKACKRFVEMLKPLRNPANVRSGVRPVFSSPSRPGKIRVGRGDSVLDGIEISVRRVFERTVSALCYEIARAYEADGFHPPYNDVVRFVLGQYERMPPLLAALMRAGTLAFGLSSMAEGSLFYGLDLPRRRVRVESWSTSHLLPLRYVMRFHRSLVVFALYSRDNGNESA